MTETANPSARYSQSQIQKALLCLLEKNMYSEITVKEIIYEAKIARKTFYRNFESKDDVLNSLINEVLQDYEKRILSLEEEDLGDFFDMVFDFSQNHILFLQLLDKNKMMSLLFSGLNDFIPIIHEKFCSDCNIFSGLTASQTEYTIAFNIGALWNVINKWISEEMKTPREEIKRGIMMYLENFGKMADS